MKYILKLVVVLLIATSCKETKQSFSLETFPENKVMVVAHRGDWREAPENSIWAIKKAIEAGAHMAEIDLALTKDSVIILMHDLTLDRTTTGKGSPSDYTLAEIKELYLRDGAGTATRMRVPTLEEVLRLSKGKIFLNLDKGFNYIGLIYPMLKENDMLDEVLFKGGTDYETFNRLYGDIKDDIVFMPILSLSKYGVEKSREFINEYLENYKPYGFEFTVGETEEHMIDFSKLRDENIRVWVNSLWYHHNAGNHDDVALVDPDVYEWYINNNVNMIQTDRIKELVDYLKRSGHYYSFN